MPNHITNKLFFSGNQKDIDIMLEAICTQDAEEKNTMYIDFQKIVPMPKELIGTVSPQRANEGESEEDFNARMQELKDKTGGYVDWHSWSINHWGTKWNAYAQHKGDDFIEFQTAWSTPAPVIEALSSQYPGLEFHCQYADEDMGSNCGEYWFKQGMETDHYCADGDSEENALQFACEVQGLDYIEYKKDNERYQCEKGLCVRERKEQKACNTCEDKLKCELSGKGEIIEVNAEVKA